MVPSASPRIVSRPLPTEIASGRAAALAVVARPVVRGPMRSLIAEPVNSSRPISFHPSSWPPGCRRRPTGARRASRCRRRVAAAAGAVVGRTRGRRDRVGAGPSAGAEVAAAGWVRRADQGGVEVRAGGGVARPQGHGDRGGHEHGRHARDRRRQPTRARTAASGSSSRRWRPVVSTGRPRSAEIRSISSLTSTVPHRAILQVVGGSLHGREP